MCSTCPHRSVRAALRSDLGQSFHSGVFLSKTARQRIKDLRRSRTLCKIDRVAQAPACKMAHTIKLPYCVARHVTPSCDWPIKRHTFRTSCTQSSLRGSIATYATFRPAGNGTPLLQVLRSALQAPLPQQTKKLGSRCFSNFVKLRPCSNVVWFMNKPFTDCSGSRAMSASPSRFQHNEIDFPMFPAGATGRTNRRRGRLAKPRAAPRCGGGRVA